ncbi:hypothetical protein Ae201684_018915 [Aphanomyces euteiches]|uniref:WRKY19-like zinc finger domain-containing protein n=1 Tax=Aphanomyces euteiches TaxID=100861 RepID=A0A6G0W402_9STRA|nr:hypothetical protein Ae201684_018915 [Aphanomyces euteiches]
MDLLATVFHNEFLQGASSATEAAPATATPTIESIVASSKRRCNVAGCANVLVSKGRCIRHGGGGRCRIDGCDTSSKRGGLCWKHGGSQACQHEGCPNLTKSRGLCWSHGGGKPCASEGCDRPCLRGGYCWSHGGGKRCKVTECLRPAYKRNQNYCDQHWAEQSSNNHTSASYLRCLVVFIFSFTILSKRR